jgi:predicted Zn-dependent protease
MHPTQFIIKVVSLAFIANCIFSVTTQAQGLFTTQKEVLRQSRLQWLTMKRDMSRPGNPRIQPFVECITNALIDTLDEPFASMDWEIIVFDDESANAFAMPGGKIGVFTGIFEVADNPDALAAVIGHEIAHLTENHVMARARRGTLTGIATILGGAATGLRGTVQQGVQVGLSLPFDRAQESEADVVGLDYMAKAGFDPRSSLRLWKNMSARRNGQRVPEFLSTHPADDRRMDDLVKAMTPALITSVKAQETGNISNCVP